jgi:hypothetical protein
MGFGRIVEAFDVYVKEFRVFMLAELSVFDVLLKFLRADEAVFLGLEGVFDDVGTFVANFAILGDSVGAVGVVQAGEFDFVGQTLVEVMPAQ